MGRRQLGIHQRRFERGNARLRVGDRGGQFGDGGDAHGQLGDRRELRRDGHVSRPGADQRTGLGQHADRRRPIHAGRRGRERARGRGDLRRSRRRRHARRLPNFAKWPVVRQRQSGVGTRLPAGRLRGGLGFGRGRRVREQRGLAGEGDAGCGHGAQQRIPRRRTSGGAGHAVRQHLRLRVEQPLPPDRIGQHPGERLHGHGAAGGARHELVARRRRDVRAGAVRRQQLRLPLRDHEPARRGRPRQRDLPVRRQRPQDDQLQHFGRGRFQLHPVFAAVRDRRGAHCRRRLRVPAQSGFQQRLRHPAGRRPRHDPGEPHRFRDQRRPGDRVQRAGHRGDRRGQRGGRRVSGRRRRKPSRGGRRTGHPRGRRACRHPRQLGGLRQQRRAVHLWGLRNGHRSFRGREQRAVSQLRGGFRGRRHRAVQLSGGAGHGLPHRGVSAGSDARQRRARAGLARFAPERPVGQLGGGIGAGRPVAVRLLRHGNRRQPDRLRARAGPVALQREPRSPRRQQLEPDDRPAQSRAGKRGGGQWRPRHLRRTQRVAGAGQRGRRHPHFRQLDRPLARHEPAEFRQRHLPVRREQRLDRRQHRHLRGQPRRRQRRVGHPAFGVPRSAGLQQRRRRLFQPPRQPGHSESRRHPRRRAGGLHHRRRGAIRAQLRLRQPARRHPCRQRDDHAVQQRHPRQFRRRGLDGAGGDSQRRKRHPRRRRPQLDWRGDGAVGRQPGGQRGVGQRLQRPGGRGMEQQRRRQLRRRGRHRQRPTGQRPARHRFGLFLRLHRQSGMGQRGRRERRPRHLAERRRDEQSGPEQPHRRGA